MKFILFFVIFLSVAFCFDINKSNVISQEQRLNAITENCELPPIKYVVAENSQKSAEILELTLLINEKDWSLQNLTNLFRYLSKNNRDASSNVLLSIKIKTDWSQLNFPSYCPPSGSSGDSVYTAKTYEFLEANFIRRRNQPEYFDYTEKRNVAKLTRVVLSGNPLK